MHCDIWVKYFYFFNYFVVNKYFCPDCSYCKVLIISVWYSFSRQKRILKNDSKRYYVACNLLWTGLYCLQTRNDMCVCVYMALFGFIARDTIICMDQWLAPTCGRRTKANRLSARGGTIQETAQLYLTSTRDKENKFSVFVSVTNCNAPEALSMEE